ncbi:hypothetical protein CCR75_001749 [Bremia lactucae]|uniref:WRKY19-like zinc finger domain-containing protein n=1 Tax=Bremia lactucae TaxID=4779 RepID=A0A976FS40_BRELC|nr:hypothetical protein CCR75_001749 [Bremia lactucae]
MTGRIEPRDSPPLVPTTETISISMDLGTVHTSSIKLPRNHNLVKTLKRLMPPNATPLQPLQYACEPNMGAFAIPTLSAQPYQQNARYQTPLAAYLPQSPRYNSDNSTSNGTCVYPYTQQHASDSNGTVFKRRRRSANTPNYSKRCRVVHCEKISVSRGLCRGHGGGRRCQHFDCTKGAQSRSDFCWAHGGGQRCEVKGCTRSRKSKSLCVAHLNLAITPLATDKHFLNHFELSVPTVVSPISLTIPTGSPRLPSLLEALRNTQQSSMIV